MQIKINNNREKTSRTRSKTLQGEHGKSRIVIIKAEQDGDSRDTTRQIRICTNTEGCPINKRDRKNENGGSPTDLEAINQLNKARSELQEEAEEAARHERIAGGREPDGDQRRNRNTGEVATEEAEADRVEATKRDIITQIR